MFVPACYRSPHDRGVAVAGGGRRVGRRRGRAGEPVLGRGAGRSPRRHRGVPGDGVPARQRPARSSTRCRRPPHAVPLHDQRLPGVQPRLHLLLRPAHPRVPGPRTSARTSTAGSWSRSTPSSGCGPSWRPGGGRATHIAMGTNTDPYQRCEGKYHLTQGIVGVLSDAANPFSILTKSTLILRDLDLLAAAARRTDVQRQPLDRHARRGGLAAHRTGHAAPAAPRGGGAPAQRGRRAVRRARRPRAPRPVGRRRPAAGGGRGVRGRRRRRACRSSPSTCAPASASTSWPAWRGDRPDLVDAVRARPARRTCPNVSRKSCRRASTSCLADVRRAPRPSSGWPRPRGPAAAAPPRPAPVRPSAVTADDLTTRAAAVIAAIEPGDVWTYGEVAEAAGRPGRGARRRPVARHDRPRAAVVASRHRQRPARARPRGRACPPPRGRRRRRRPRSRGRVRPDPSA